MPDLTAATLRQAIADRRLLNSDAAMILIELHHADQFLRLLEAEEIARPKCSVCLDGGWVWSRDRTHKVYAGARCPSCKGGAA